MQNIADSFFNTYSSRSYGVEGIWNFILVFHSSFLLISNLLRQFFDLLVQTISIPLLCSMKEKELHHLQRRKEDMWGSLYTRLIPFRECWVIATLFTVISMYLTFFSLFWQTPHGSLLDILRNACDLLSKCDIKLPEVHLNFVQRRYQICSIGSCFSFITS